MDSIFRHGKPQTTEYTPVGAIAAGQVIVTGAALTPVIAHHDIAAGELGSVATKDGVYEFINLDNAADFAKVYWNDTVKKVTTTASGNGQIGFVVKDGGKGANSKCLVLHAPANG